MSLKRKHHVCLVVWLGPMFVLVASSMTMFGRQGKIVVVAVGAVLILLMSQYLASAGSGTAPFLQKMVVIVALIWLLAICYHSLTAVVQEFVVRATIGDDRRTRNYIDRLQTQGLYPPEGRGSGNQNRGRPSD